MLDFVVQQHLS